MSLSKLPIRARLRGKTVIMVAHAVPSWEMHRKPSTGEGQVTEQNLRVLVGKIKPDELVYGHEHFIVKDESGESMLDKKYRLLPKGKKVTVDTSYEDVSELDEKNGGVIASHVPVPGQDFAGIASLEIPKLVKNKKPRGLGGKRAPVRVGKKPVPLKDIPEELPTSDIFIPSSLR